MVLVPEITVSVHPDRLVENVTVMTAAPQEVTKVKQRQRRRQLHNNKKIMKS